MIMSNCFIVNDNIYIITACSRGESLNKYGKYKWYYTIVNVKTGNRKKLTEEGIKNTFKNYRIEWQKPQLDMRNINL